MRGDDGQRGPALQTCRTPAPAPSTASAPSIASSPSIASAPSTASAPSFAPARGRTCAFALALSCLAALPARAALPNGVAAGDVTADTAVLWARSTVPGEVVFEISPRDDFPDAETVQVFAAVADPTVPAKVEIAGLSPDARYFYRATDAEGARAAGRFRTPALTGRRGMRFGVSGDWRGELAPYPSVRNVPQRELDLWISLGDTIYADYASPAVPKPQAQTLAEYRAKHAEVYTERFGLNTLRDLRESCAILAMIDDHEVGNDIAGAARTSSDPRFAGDPADLINNTQLFRDALQAFLEYHPIRDERWPLDAEARFSGRPRLYRVRRYGDDAVIFLTDARTFRDETVPSLFDVTNPLMLIDSYFQTFTPGRTMLGRTQFSRLLADLEAAHEAGVTWKFVVVPEPIQNLGVALAEDRFEGFAVERAELLSFIRRKGIANVVFIAADVHGTVVNNLKYQEKLGGPQTRVAAFEITTGSVAYAAPLGPTAIRVAAGVGLVPPAELAQYEASDRVGRDAFFTQKLNQQLEPFRYDPAGLEGSEIDATLLSGSYVSAHTFGWSEFEIDAQTQALTVTTWGIDWYDEAELLADPAAVTSRTPEVVSRFVVRPQTASAPPTRPPACGWACAAPAALLLAGLRFLRSGWLRTCGGH
jgi:phosphodiesterase/alkaline phosphatase D-like protein